MSITKLRDTLNLDLKKFRERQREIFPRLKLSALDVDEPELTVIQLPSYRMKHGQWPTAPDANDQDSQLREAEIKLRCTEADSGILAVQAASLALSAAKKAREQDYRGQAGITRSQRNLQKAELMKTFEITMYNNARTALIHLRHMEADAVEPYRPLSHRDTRRKETHLHRAKGDSRLFNGTAWYLQSGVTISQAAVVSPVSQGEQDDEDDEPQLLAGIQTLKRSGMAAPRSLLHMLTYIQEVCSTIVAAKNVSGISLLKMWTCIRRRHLTRRRTTWRRRRLNGEGVRRGRRA
jgi:hypothetical protein